jgi:two-component system nitrogen regulation sensor histidine kinase NtrY
VLGRAGARCSSVQPLLFGVSLRWSACGVVRAALRRPPGEAARRLVTAAREVGAGNYALRVTGRTGPDEIGLLNRAFNRMTSQIERQTDALIGANRQLAERRAFIEAVLQSITAGSSRSTCRARSC